MKVDYINPFIHATQKVLNTMAFVESTRGNPFVKEGSISTGEISAIIQLEGGTQGSISISFSKECALRIAENMMGEGFNEINDDIADMVGEIINMISGEARRNLSEEGFLFEAGIPETLQGNNHDLPHAAQGPTIQIPFETSSGHFTLEACFESTEYFEKVAESLSEEEIKSGNNSVLDIQISSFIASTPSPFSALLLKQNSQITASNLFLIPEYVKALPSFDSCNYMKLEVFVCPDTYFASNCIDYFKHGHNSSNKYLQSASFADELTQKLSQMKMLGKLSDNFYSPHRTNEEGIKSFNLAMFTSNMLFNLNQKVFWAELNRACEYSLKAALLCKYQLNREREIKYLKNGFKLQKKMYSLLSNLGKDKELFHTLYLMTAIALYIGETKNAQNAAELQLVRFKKGFGKQTTVEDRKIAIAYIELTKKIWQSRELIIEAGKNTSHKSYLIDGLSFKLPTD